MAKGYKLSDAQIATIEEMIRAGKTVGQICEKMVLSYFTVYKRALAYRQQYQIGPKKYMRDRDFEDEPAKAPIVRPKPEYSNKSPYGIARPGIQ